MGIVAQLLPDASDDDGAVVVLAAAVDGVAGIALGREKVKAVSEALLEVE